MVWAVYGQPLLQRSVIVEEIRGEPDRDTGPEELKGALHATDTGEGESVCEEQGRTSASAAELGEPTGAKCRRHDFLVVEGNARRCRSSPGRLHRPGLSRDLLNLVAQPVGPATPNSQLTSYESMLC